MCKETENDFSRELDAAMVLKDASVGTMVIRFLQDPNPKGLRRALRIDHNMQQWIMYEARIEVLLDGKAEIKETDVCPVGSNSEGFEQWPYPIGRIVLSDIHLLSEAEAQKVDRKSTRLNSSH